LITGAAGLDRATLLLAGVALSAFLSALSSLFVALSGRADLERQTLFWLLGGLQNARTSNLPALIISLFAGMTLLLFHHATSTLCALGMRSGLVGRLRVGASKAIALRRVFARRRVCRDGGLVGFVGLLAPHAMRLLFGTDARALLPASALGGATMLMGCDALADRLSRPSRCHSAL
jgi:iron complex transport system permease protein